MLKASSSALAGTAVASMHKAATTRSKHVLADLHECMLAAGSSSVQTLSIRHFPRNFGPVSGLDFGLDFDIGGLQAKLHTLSQDAPTPPPSKKAENQILKSNKIKKSKFKHDQKLKIETVEERGGQSWGEGMMGWRIHAKPEIWAEI